MSVGSLGTAFSGDVMVLGVVYDMTITSIHCHYVTLQLQYIPGNGLYVHVHKRTAKSIITNPLIDSHTS